MSIDPNNWRAVKDYQAFDDDLALVLCRVTLPQTSEFPRACEMPVSSGDHAVGDVFISIGHANDEGEWFVAGWDMVQDCWTDARCFDVLGWQPLEAAPMVETSLPLRDLEPLYRDLTAAFPHPFDWIAGVKAYGAKRPPFWRRKERQGHDLIRAIFQSQGLHMTPTFCARFQKNPDAWEAYGLGAGGQIICDLAYALEPQTGVSWRRYL